MNSLKSIKLRIAEKLKDEGYRRRFFRGLAQDEVAQQIRSLRKKRGLIQKDLARQTGMYQSAVSRLEQAEYSRWSLPTLWRIADALDARIRVIFEPAEDVLKHYERLEATSDVSKDTALEDEARSPTTQGLLSARATEFVGPADTLEGVEKGRRIHQLHSARATISDVEKALIKHEAHIERT